MRLPVLLLALALVGCGEDEAPNEPVADEPEITSAPPPKEKGKDAPPSGAAPQCAAGADIEIEDNDTADKATEVRALKFCGVLADANDVDHFTFTTPAGTKLGVLQAVVTMPVDIQVTVGGATYELGDPALQTSGTFVVKISARDGKPSAYQARLQYDAN